jgi:hypothetical protein
MCDSPWALSSPNRSTLAIGRLRLYPFGTLGGQDMNVKPFKDLEKI